MIYLPMSRSLSMQWLKQRPRSIDLEKLLKNEGHMPEDKFLVMSRKGKRLGVAFASTPRGEGGAGFLRFKTKWAEASSPRLGPRPPSGVMNLRRFIPGRAASTCRKNCSPSPTRWLNTEASLLRLLTAAYGTDRTRKSRRLMSVHWGKADSPRTFLRQPVLTHTGRRPGRNSAAQQSPCVLRCDILPVARLEALGNEAARFHHAARRRRMADRGAHASEQESHLVSG